MDKRLFVGGLPYSMTDQALADLFAQCGTVVSANVIMDRFSGRSKGFGFVEMSTEEEAKAAVEKLNDTEVEGRKIVVNIARPREERPQNSSYGSYSQRDRGGDRGGHGGGSDRRGGSGGGRQNRW